MTLAALLFVTLVALLWIGCAVTFVALLWIGRVVTPVTLLCIGRAVTHVALLWTLSLATDCLFCAVKHYPSC